jgi:OOP family OmpA-OmpF porin
MRILITGLVVFVIWSLFSTWLFVTRLRPAMQEPVTIQTVPEPTAEVAEPPAQPVEPVPKDLTIYFEFDKSRFTPDPQAEASAAEFKAWLEKHPESTIVVTGHTDYIGNQPYNLELGLKRARTVLKYLETKGIPQSRVTIDSKGEDQPAADNTTSEGRAKNRRTEITIKK